jgi:hypothetical protein
METKIVKHKTFGKGKIVEEKGDFVEVEFGGSLRLVPKSEVEPVKTKGAVPTKKKIKKGVISLEVK